MTRQRRRWPPGALAILCAGLAVASCQRRAVADLHPIAGQNVFLITIDTLRADALSCYGGAAATPALDRLAGEGVRFEFAHAHSVLTLPSHASILTGQYPFQHGVRDNSGYRVAPEARTVATLLKERGYRTAAFVAAFPLHSRFGLNHGFDVYDDRFGDTRAPTEFAMPERSAADMVPLARGWLAERVKAPAGERWFVWLHLFDPHAPYRPPAPFDARYAGRPYYGEVAAADAALAPLLDDLRASPRPTLVIVTGDHGEGLGEHGEQSHGLFAYESTLRVPLILAQLGSSSGARAGGEVSPVAARHVDILPTILDAVGQAPPPDLPGRTLLPAAERVSGSSPRPSYFEAMSAMLNRGWAPLTGVLIDRDKYIELPLPERYDLKTDPAEHENLFGRSAERDRTLAAALGAFATTPPGTRRAEAADAAARLRALGYVSGNAPAKARYTEADDPKTLVALEQAMHDAVDAFGAGRFEDAAQLYQRVIASRSDMAIAYRHLAFIEAQRGRLNVAIDVLQRALRAGVSDASAAAQLGGYLADAGQTAQAIRLLEPIAANADADVDTLNLLGITYARAGRRPDAGRMFERVLALNPQSSVPLENLGMLALDAGDLALARRHFERAVQADPRSSRAHADLGVVASRSGDAAAAIEEWKRAVQLDRTNFDALYNLGVTLAQRGQPDAQSYLEQFARTAPPSFYANDLREVARILGTLR
ncbi:MAG: sulfatase-like hydrolase/transferase [Acidobacteriia bacterium]|nr:sulfatase-like hydrolase/transferase [Terriglobia bacterium]